MTYLNRNMVFHSFQLHLKEWHFEIHCPPFIQCGKKIELFETQNESAAYRMRYGTMVTTI